MNAQLTFQTFILQTQMYDFYLDWSEKNIKQPIIANIASDENMSYLRLRCCPFY